MTGPGSWVPEEIMIKTNRFMDIFNMLFGVCLILISIIIFVIQIRDKAYTKKEFHMGNVNIYYAGIASLLAGLYFFISAF